MIRALLFDFNGVLVDDEPIHLELLQRVLGEEGVRLSEEDYYGRYLGLDDRACFAAVLGAAGEKATASRLARLVARKASYYRERMLAGGYPVFPGAAELVGAAAARGWLLGIVSGALRQLGLARHFKVLVTAEDVADGKPDPEGYRLALEALNARPPLPERMVHPHEVLALEDSLAGIRAAAEAGLLTLGVAHTYGAGDLRGAHAVVPALAGLTPERLEALFA